MKILIGLSGGLDSSYAAHILKEDGHEVFGAAVIMHEFTDITSAKRCAEEIGIPFVIIDMRDTFKQRVVSRFIDDYLSGRTPNPCVECNPAIKFAALCDYAKENGFDAVSTGHYARIGFEDGRYFIKRPLDRSKDQSYVLWKLSQNQLGMLFFPLSELSKDEIRRRAASLSLSALDAKESQEICFIPDDDYPSFIEKETGMTFPEGDFIDIDGKILGKHSGIIRYTVGQRKGLGISLGERMFVSNIDPESNTVTLVPSGEEYSSGAVIDEISFMKLSPRSVGDTIECCVKVRYASEPAPCKVVFKSDGAELSFASPIRAVTPGQSAVFFDGDDLLFGGIIKKAFTASAE